MSEQLQSLLDIAAGKQRGWQREKGESSLAEKSSWETRMHSGFFGEKEHTQPACHCHCNFQPRSHSCTGLRRDERHFIEESCFIFPSDICNRPRGMLQSIYVHWDTTTRSRLGFILLLSCWVFPTPKCCISHPTARIWTERDQNIIPNGSGRDTYTAFRERGKKGKTKCKILLASRSPTPMRNCSDVLSLPAHKRKKKIFVPLPVESFSFITTKKLNSQKTAGQWQETKGWKISPEKGQSLWREQENISTVCHQTGRSKTVISLWAKLRNLIPKH